MLSIRIDESLCFANARYLEDFVAEQAALVPDLTDVVLMCSAGNAIDMSALESLDATHFACMTWVSACSS